MKPCESCGAKPYMQHFSWCVIPQEKRCGCGVMHFEEADECPICQMEAERERSKPRTPNPRHTGGRA